MPYNSAMPNAHPVLAVESVVTHAHIQQRTPKKQGWKL